MPDDHPNSENQEPGAGRDCHQPSESAPEKSNFCIVGLGASAGGLEAFKIFFDNMPADSDMAFVLVTHLSPTHESHVAELLSRHTDMPVTEAEDGMAVAPNHVYVIPPDAALTMRKRMLLVAKSARPTGGRTTIDDFFISLAEDQGRSAICVVLSGTGSDGATGLKAIKQHGGLTITQAEGSAEYEDMPRSARATGQGDYMLAVQDMPARLLEYDGHIQTVGDGEIAEKLREDRHDCLARILRLLREQAGHDFSQYKESTVVRRIERRMQVTQAASPEAYLERLRTSPAEIELLFNDMLINVTAFMRDPQVFDQLTREFVPAICRGKNQKDASIRVWVPGCATGEEVYSLALIFLEALSRPGRNLRLQVFGSDVDAQALEVARAGVYPHAVAKQLSPERLERFFCEHDCGYAVTKALREPCMFSRHDVINNPPFSRLDLISCRNVLIYMNPVLQKRLIPVFHYALRPDGLLLLGPSETVIGFDELFEPVDHKLRIYRRKAAALIPRYAFSGSFASQFKSHQPPERHHRRDGDIRRHVERYLLDQYAPSCVIVNTRFDAVHYFGSTGQFLEQPAGAPDSNILSLARQGLRTHLRAALEQAAREHETVVRDNIRVKTNGDYMTIHLRVRPVRREAATADYYAVIFEPAGQQTTTATPAPARPTPEQEQALVGQLEEALRLNQRQLQMNIEDLEASNEELKSSNEELMSTNEELQSTAEELDTSKEELQSVNEELVVANDELRRHADDVAHANSDIKNLLDNTQIAMMFLDERFRIKMLTPRMSDLYHVRESDIGRPILEIRAKHDYGELEADARRVLDTHAHVERQARANGYEYILRLLPYRTLDGRVDGVVAAFIDITNLAHAREEIGRMARSRQQRAGELELMLSMLPVGVAICTDPEGRHVRTNKIGAEILGVEENADVAGHEQPELFSILRDDRVLTPAEFPIQCVLATCEPVRDLTLKVRRRDGSNRDIEFSAWPVLDEDGKSRGAVGVLLDVTERKRELEFQTLQHKVIAQLGVFALYENDITLVMRRVLKDICATLNVDHAEIWRFGGDQDRRLLLEMSTACGSSQVNEVSISDDLESPIGRTVISGETLTVQNSASEPLHTHLPHLSDQGVVCTVSAPIRHGDEIYGVLSMHHSERRHFLPYETNFLQLIADLLGGVLRRKQLEIGHGQDQRRQGFADAEERMRQAERLASLGTLAAGIAHEVNNPLNSILMNAELGLISLKTANAEEKLTKLLTNIVKEAQRGGSITRNVLHFSKADRYTPKGHADLNNLVGRVREHVASVLQKHNAKLDLELEESLPSLDLNQIAMEQAMVNLISNAAQSGASRIVVKINRQTRHVRIIVSDDGRGIPQQELEHIFDPFYTTRRSQGGSGLGLSLVHRIVADHNGTVEAHSGAGEGTRFIVRLPLSRNQSEPSG